jgi:hypothetical protein
LQRAFAGSAENYLGAIGGGDYFDALLFAEPDAGVSGQGAEKSFDFGARDGVDSDGGAGKLFEDGKDAVVSFGDGEAFGEVANDGVEGLGIGFEDDADGVFGEGVFEVEGEEEGEFEVGDFRRRFFDEKTRQPPAPGRQGVSRLAPVGIADPENELSGPSTAPSPGVGRLPDCNNAKPAARAWGQTRPVRRDSAQVQRTSIFETRSARMIWASLIFSAPWMRARMMLPSRRASWTRPRSTMTRASVSAGQPPMSARRSVVSSTIGMTLSCHKIGWGVSLAWLKWTRGLKNKPFSSYRHPPLIPALFKQEGMKS